MKSIIQCKPEDDRAKVDGILYYTGTGWTDDRKKAKEYDTRAEALEIFKPMAGKPICGGGYRTPVVVTK